MNKDWILSELGAKHRLDHLGVFTAQFDPMDQPGLLGGGCTGALFSSPSKSKSFQDSPSHRILWHMYETLNIDENKN